VTNLCPEGHISRHAVGTGNIGQGKMGRSNKKNREGSVRHCIVTGRLNFTDLRVLILYPLVLMIEIGRRQG